jgi:hypothetical protein
LVSLKRVGAISTLFAFLHRLYAFTLVAAVASS